MYEGFRVSVVIPAFNEEKAIGKVVESLRALRDDQGVPIIDEVVVCDNGSTDDTASAAQAKGAKVVREERRGYGNACLAALGHIKPCDIVLFVDGDDSCFVNQAIPLIQGIALGNDLAIGSRPMGNMARGALTPVQIFGNRLSAFLIRLLWNYRITDLGPFRAIRYTALKRINMQDKTFGWTVEMQIKAIQLEMKIVECPVDSRVRIGQSKISGTIKGSILAGVGILSKIFLLRAAQKRILREALSQGA